MTHLTALKIPPQSSFATNRQASVIQHTKHKQCQEHDDTSKYSNCYTCDLRAERKVLGEGKHLLYLKTFILSNCNQKRALLTCLQVYHDLHSFWAQGLCIWWGDKHHKWTHSHSNTQCFHQTITSQLELTSLEQICFSLTYPLVQLRWQSSQWPDALGYLNMVWPFSPFTPLGQAETQWGPSIRFKHATHWSAPWYTKTNLNKLYINRTNIPVTKHLH